MTKQQWRQWIKKSKDFYSQYGEDKIISDNIPADMQGNILDIGANDGKTLSNSLYFINRGWGATLIEGSPITAEKLQTLHKDNNQVQCLNVCLSDKEDTVTFYHNTSHMGVGDADLLSTIDRDSFLDSNRGNPFEQFEVTCYPFSHCELQHETYNIVSIDIEGLDYDILTQIDLGKIGCEILVIEYHGHEKLKKQIMDYCAPFGLTKIMHDNKTNIILAENLALFH